jgi:hypothetical protein
MPQVDPDPHGRRLTGAALFAVVGAFVLLILLLFLR